jgi:hypothetical protein
MINQDEIIKRLDLLEIARSQDMTVILTRFDDLDQRLEDVEKSLALVHEQLGAIALLLQRRYGNPDSNYERTGE